MSCRPAGRLAEVAAPAGVTMLSYDAVWRRVGAVGPGGQVAYEWDARGRLGSETAEEGSSTTLVERAWDAEDRLASLSVSVDGGPGEVTSLWWDALPAAAATADLVVGEVYLPFGQPDGPGEAGVVGLGYRGELHAGGASLSCFNGPC